MKILHVTLAILICAVGSAVWAAEPQKVVVKREIGELKRIARTILNRLQRLEASLSPNQPLVASKSLTASKPLGRGKLLGSGPQTRSKLLNLRFITPEKTFETLQGALAKKQWGMAVNCYTPRARTEITKAMVLVSALATIGIEDKRRRDQYARDLEKLNTKHFPPTLASGSGLNGFGEALERALAESIVEGRVTDNLQKAAVQSALRRIAVQQTLAKGELEQLVKRIRSRDAYLVSVLSLIAKFSESPVDYSSQRLLDVKVSGNIARGFLKSKGKPRMRVTFKRDNGAWRVDQVN